MDNIIEVLQSDWKRPLPRTTRTVNTSLGTSITFVTGSAQRRLVGRGSKGTLEEKFFERVNKTATCWLWTGSISKDGYARFSLGKVNGKPKTVFAHRWSYETFVGPIPEGLVIDHVAERCNHRNCVNPDHLEPTTGGDNVSRGWTHKRSKALQCINLHEYAVVGRTKNNECVQCSRDKVNKWRKENIEQSRKSNAISEAKRREKYRDKINARNRELYAEKKSS